MGAGPPASSLSSCGERGARLPRGSAIHHHPVLQWWARRKEASQHCPRVPLPRLGWSSGPALQPGALPRVSPACRPPACPSSPGARRVPAGERSILHLVTTDVPPPRSAPPGVKRRHRPAPGTVLSSDISASKRDAGAWGLIWSGAAQRVEDRDHQPGIVFRLGGWVVQALPQNQDGCISAHLEPAMLCSTLETPSLRFPRGSCSARARDRLFPPGFVVD